jgi:predicted nucleic-acid-binding protein
LRGVDTNVLVRFVTDDDPRQSPRARRFIEDAEERGERLFVNTAVICELCWTLRSEPYQYDRSSIAAVLEHMLEARIFELEHRDLILRSTRDYRSGRADFADYLIGHRNFAAGCDDTATFDRRLAKVEGFSPL